MLKRSCLIMNRQCILISIFCVVIVIISAKKSKDEYPIINKLDEIELNEENDPVEIFYSTDRLVDNVKSLFKNDTLKNRNAESMTNIESITKGQIVSAISSIEVNGKQERLNDVYRLEDDQYSIGHSRKKGLIVDLAHETKLAATPGTDHTLVFCVTNNLEDVFLHEIKIDTLLHYELLFSPRLLIYGRQSVKLSVRLWIPQDVGTNNIIDTVTFSVRRTYDSTEVQSSARIYSRNALTVGSRKRDPTIDYEFYDNCNGKLKTERCKFSRWSVKITVTNNESGLGWKGITSEPNGIWPERDFIAGDKNLPTFIYSASCCSKSVEIKITDVLNNAYSQIIDVTEWSNLGLGEILAIVIGTLFLLLLLIILIVLCVRCVKKQKNADLSYTHRYGSRPPA